MGDARDGETETPPTPSGLMRHPALAKIEAEGEPAWYWCPTCKLVSTRAGDCPTCAQAYVPAPDAGIPDTPYEARSDGTGTAPSTGRGYAGIIALFGAAAAAIFLLATLGQPASSVLGDKLSITPTQIDFGDVTVGTRSPQQTVTVTNISSNPLTMDMAGGAAGPFGGVQDCQGRTLAPGASCHMFFAFSPSAPGPITGRSSGTLNGQRFLVTFQGNGV